MLHTSSCFSWPPHPLQGHREDAGANPLMKTFLNEPPAHWRGLIWAFGGWPPCLWVPRQCSEGVLEPRTLCFSALAPTGSYHHANIQLGTMKRHQISRQPLYSRNVLWWDYLVLCPQIDFYRLLHRFPQKENPPVSEAERLEYNAVWLLQSTF